MTGLEPYAAPLVLVVVALLFAAFVWERFSPEVVAVGGVAVLLGLGLLSTDELLGVFSNSAPLTIAAMFVLSGALQRTGVINSAGQAICSIAERNPWLAMPILLGTVMAVSAFVNNTPVVVVMIPIVMTLARTLGQAPSRLLIPMSYATILGGTCTLIGTSTNLLVDGVARRHGLAPFGLFEITMPALLMGGAGLVWMTLMARRLLPDRQTLTSIMGSDTTPRFLTEVMIPYDSPLLGRRLSDVGVFQQSDGRVVDVLRGDESLRRRLADVVLEAGDRVILKTRIAEVMSLREAGQVAFPGAHTFEPVASRPSVVIEGLVGPNSSMVGQRVGDLRIRRHYGVYPLAVHRHGENVGRNLDDVALEVGDALLLEGPEEDVLRLTREKGLINPTEPRERAYRRSKAPVVAIVVAAVVLLAAFGVMPIAGLAVLGVAVVLFTRCLDADEAWQSIDWRILILIFAMLAVGRAMEESGAFLLIIGAIEPWLHGLPPVLLLAVVYFTASFMTEIVTNNAVAVIITPLAIVLAQEVGVDPRPFVVAVMFGASATFATPIGYQTNTMVYSAGGYRFTDFLRIGAPMNVIVGIVAVSAIPFFWPFYP